MISEPGAAVLSIFDQLTRRIKELSPSRSDDKPINTRVYSQLVSGMPIWREDYFRPWTPAGGSSLREAVNQGQGQINGPTEADKREALRAMQAAWKTSMLCRTMLQVTKDDNYREYPTGRHIDFAYESIIFGMQPGNQVEMAPEIKQRIAEAEKVLFKLDEEGNHIGKTPLYENYIKNANALADAKANFALQFQIHQRDPEKLEIWPVVSEKFNLAIKQARDSLISEGAAKVERALDALASIGQPVQEHMVAKAKENFDNWNLGLTGVVPGKMPYSLVLPTNWCDHEDHNGFATLTVDRAEINFFSSSNSISSSAQSWMQKAESNSAGGGVLAFGFLGFAADHSSTKVDTGFQNSSSSQFHSIFHNTAKNLHIELEYGLCSIIRPWLVSDLFPLKNWFLAGNKKSSISDGTIDGQIDSMEKILPMIPQQCLVIRNVVISTTEWGSDGELLSQFYANNQGETHAETADTSGMAGVTFGPINFGGRASHSEASADGESSSFSSNSSLNNFRTTFDGQSLRIPGTQIIAFLCDIVPACPELDDPALI